MQKVAIIGTGVAGATAAARLAAAGHHVHLFDKSRGVGGRMATRRVAWTDPAGDSHTASIDHGAPGFTARSPAFQGFVDQMHRAGALARWTPVMAPSGIAPLDGLASWVPVPDMPSLCRRLLDGLTVTTGREVDALRRDGRHWRVEARGEVLDEGFDRIVIAIPPPQAAALLLPHRADWSQRALWQPMVPCWTLMGIADDDSTGPGWDVAWPRGPLASIVRNDSKPGRQRTAGRAQWVAHATAAWSQVHLETPAVEVLAALQAAMSAWFGRPLHWHLAVVHRWRYASVPRSDTAAVNRCWWDPALGLGVCGDFLGGAGVEGAWMSAQALATSMTTADDSQPATPDFSSPSRSFT